MNGRVKALDTRRITTLALLVAVSLVVSFIESMLPPPMLLAPGAKLGLGNVAAIIALITLGIGDAYIVTALKCLLSAAITGSVSGLMYSVPAGMLAITVEVIVFYTLFPKLSLPMISLIGAVAFNCAQLVVASLITGIWLWALLPMLLTASVLAGAFTGLLAYAIIKKLPMSVFTASRY